MGLAGLACIAAICGVALLATEKPSDRAAPTQTSVTASVGKAGAPSHPVAELGDRSAVAWLAKLFDVPKPPPPQAATVAEPDPHLPDPRAATRVQSFTCDGALPASRSLMCTRWDLATADYNLSLSYKTALARARNPHALRRARLLWLRQLDRLGGDVAKIQRHIEDFQRTLATA